MANDTFGCFCSVPIETEYDILLNSENNLNKMSTSVSHLKWEKYHSLMSSSAACNMLKVNIVTEVVSASKEELMVITVSEIVKQLIDAHEHNRDINLNR